MKSKGKYLMNLQSGIIHNGKQPCAVGCAMAEKIENGRTNLMSWKTSLRVVRKKVFSVRDVLRRKSSHAVLKMI